MKCFVGLVTLGDTCDLPELFISFLTGLLLCIYISLDVTRLSSFCETDYQISAKYFPFKVSSFTVYWTTVKMFKKH